MGLDRFAEDIMRTLQQYYDAHENHETHMTTVLECKQRNSFFILNGCILVGGKQERPRLELPSQI